MAPFIGSGSATGTAGINANGSADANLGLDQAVFAALAGAVKKQNDGPLLLPRPILRDEDLVLVFRARERDGAVKKAGFDFLRASGTDGEHRANECEREQR